MRIYPTQSASFLETPSLAVVTEFVPKPFLTTLRVGKRGSFVPVLVGIKEFWRVQGFPVFRVLGSACYVAQYLGFGSVRGTQVQKVVSDDEVRMTKSKPSP